jgi:hypothetical protein
VGTVEVGGDRRPVTPHSVIPVIGNQKPVSGKPVTARWRQPLMQSGFQSYLPSTRCSARSGIVEHHLAPMFALSDEPSLPVHSPLSPSVRQPPKDPTDIAELNPDLEC